MFCLLPYLLSVEQSAKDISNKVIFQMNYDKRAFSLFNFNYIFHELWQDLPESRKQEEGIGRSRSPPTYEK